MPKNALSVRSRTTQEQFETLVNFLEKNHDVLYPSSNTLKSKKMYDIAWDVLTDILNSDTSGPTKSIEKWKKTVRDWKQYVKTKADRISNSLNCSDGHLPKEVLSPLEERLACILGHTFEDENGKLIESFVNDECKSRSSSSSSKRKLDDEDDPESQDKNAIPKITDYYQKKHKKNAFEKDNDVSEEKVIKENEDRHMQARLVEAEEQKAEALQRLASSFESIAASFEFLCHTLLQKSDKSSEAKLK